MEDSIDNKQNSFEQNNEVSNLEKQWFDYLKGKIDYYCNNDGYYEVYWDYDEELDPTTIDKLTQKAVDENDSFEAIVNDYLWEIVDFPDEYLYDEVRNHIPSELEDFAEDRDLQEDLETAGYKGVDMNIRNILGKSDVRVNVVFATPTEANYDMSNIVDVFGSWKNPAYDYIVDNPEILDNAMTYLIHQQGHSLKEYYQCLLENPGGFGFNHKSTFIESVVDDCVNNSSDAMSGFTCLTTLTPYELYELRKNVKDGKGSLEFSKDTYCGTVNIWAGSGGLSVELEKPFIVPTKYAHTIQVEGSENNNGYTVDEIFGLTSDCWNGKMTFTNSQPSLYKENEEELISYIKSLAEKEEEE